ncbi:MAG: zinc ribbon domain-containing protein [Phycisphaerae bacterium]|nr:zinc ribbon domain-containing protein [Phycisphaerae bacterium]
MPTYEYKCSACGHRFDEFQSMTAKPLRTCPACGRKKLERLIGIGAAVMFKGSGFYQTDYRSESYKKAAEADKKSADPAPAKTDSATATPAGSPAAGPTPAPSTAEPKSRSSASKPAPAPKPAPRKRR